MQLKSRLTLGAAGAAVAGALVLAACGGSSTTHAAAPASASSATSDSAMTTTKQDPHLGSILADGKGLTVYTLTNNGKAVDCIGACAAVWPPLTSGNGAAVTAGGLPLYRFIQDRESDDAYGEGMATFGGVWHVVKAGSSTASTALSASAGSPGGY
jgi:predicted lipoprotein with Yx(FWY)xxD motif